MDTLLVDGQSLTLERVAQVCRANRSVALEGDARARMGKSLAWVQMAASGALKDEAGDPLPVYGVNTGYGSLARVRIEGDSIEQLSYNLIRSHAAGVGEPVPADVVRGMMLLRANALAKGASGCRPAIVDTLLAMLDADLIPEVPSQGSCGSSGDLAPLSHLGLVVFRGPIDNPEQSGWALYMGERMRGSEAMARAGIERLMCGPKEGLAMTNGAQLTTSIAALACWDADRLIKTAEIAAAMSWEAMRGVTRALHPAVHALRPYRGAIACAANLRLLMQGSELTDSLPDKVQDAYSIRCTPQIVGAVRDGVRFASEQVSVELNAATDNPLILLQADGVNKAYSAGLFHGEPVGMAADHLKLALSELAAISERRIYRLTTGTLSSRLPALLKHHDRPGMGLMVPQTTAAALVSENRALAYPSSVDSIPTCEDQEDIVAMSTTASRRAYEVLANAQRVVAIELLCAARGLRWRMTHEGVATLGQGTAAALAIVESVLDGGAQTPGEDIERLAAALAEGLVLNAVQGAVGPLQGVCDA